MIVMLSNTRGIWTGYLAGKYAGQIGHLYSVGGLTQLYPFMPFALDNGKFPAWANNQPWDVDAYRGLLDRVMDLGGKPMWALVPDAVGNRDETLREWDRWAHKLAAYGWPLAFAVQDGMTPDDVPQEAQVVFVGGTTEWKWRTLSEWCEAFDRVHVGRVNTNGKLWECREAGAESCDGTGWFRGCQEQFAGLLSYLERVANGKDNHRGRKLWD